MRDRVATVKETIFLLLEIAKSIKRDKTEDKTEDKTDVQDYILSIILQIGYSEDERYSFTMKKQLIEYFEREDISIEIWQTALTLTQHFI